MKQDVSDAKLALNSKYAFTISRKSREKSTLFDQPLLPRAEPKKAKFIRRIRSADEAHGPAADLFKRPVYAVGDGEILQAQRPDSDHSHLKTFGNPT